MVNALSRDAPPIPWRDAGVLRRDMAERGMASKPPTRTPLAGGALIAIGAMGGTIIGASQGQVTAGFLIGLGAGVAIAVAIWLVDRAR